MLLQLGLHECRVVDIRIEVVHYEGLASFECDLACRSLENLPGVHTRRNTGRRHQNLNCVALLVLRHLIVRKDSGDDALVTVATRELVSDFHGLLGTDEDRDLLSSAYDPDDFAAVLVLPAFLGWVEVSDCALELLLDVCGLSAVVLLYQLCDQDIIGLYNSADLYDSAVIQFAKNVWGRLFGACVSTPQRLIDHHIRIHLRLNGVKVV